jgi:SAM-dependent methyltransferase
MRFNINWIKLKEILASIFPTNRKLLIKKSLNSICFDKYDNILVIGSGSDPYHYLFKNIKTYVCVDLVKYPGITDIIANAQDLPIANQSFNCVFSSEVFEHLESPIKFINEAFRVLSPNGLIVLTVPFIFHEHSDPHDYWRPTKQALSLLFNKFSHVEIFPQGNRIHVILDLITTSSGSLPFFYPLRIMNHILARIPTRRNTTAPSGYLVIAKK